MAFRTGRLVRTSVKLLSLLAIFLFTAAAGSMAYFHYAPPSKSCLSCHEMQSQHDQWASSSHRNVHCRDCHGGSLTLDVHALQEHANRVIGHFSTATHDNMHLTHDQVLAVSARCRTCHESEYARWREGGHSATYAAIFLDENQNQSEMLNADCLRCHGMFFEGTTEDVVRPISTKGPWSLKRPEMEHQATIPCLTCHQVHRPGKPRETNVHAPAAFNASYYSRHEKTHFALDRLPSPAIQKNGRPIRASNDLRQRLCVQCHAPNAQHASATRDDRTPTGVHEGLSCMACHDVHSGDARNSCVTCHPAISNCGIDVAKMDTTFKSADSKNNIHFVACGDCHNGQRPQRK